MLERVDERSIARASLLDGRGALTLGIVLRGREAVADDDGRCDDIPRSGETELRVGDLEGVDAEDRSGRAVDALGRGRWLEFDLAEAAARSRAACSASARCMLTDEDDRVDALLPRLELERERLLTLGCGLEGGRLTADRLDDEDDDRCAEDGRELDRLLEGLAADRLAEDDRGAERA